MNKNRRILVVGGLAAGPSAAAKAKRVNPHAEVVLLEAGETVSYGLCEVPYAVGGVIEDEQRLVIYSPERLQEEKGIEVKTLHLAEQLDPVNRTVRTRDLSRRHAVDIPYDKLIIATGAKAKRLNLAGEDAENVFCVRSREDSRNIIAYLKKEHPKSAVIIGGGYIGMEMAEAFRLRGLDVTVIHRHRLPLSGMEEGTREQVLGELERNSVNFISNASVESMDVAPNNRVRHISTNRGAFDADLVVLALGIQPNTEFVRSARIRLGNSEGILTDERQRTNLDNIYAAGDCCEAKNIVTGKPMYIPLATIASRAGWVAGENAAGGSASFKGAIRAIAVKVFGVEVAQVGVSSDEARSAGFSASTTSITGSSRVGLMPGSRKVTITLVVEDRTRRILGANVSGGDGVAQRANILGIAVQHRFTVDDIAQFDLIYSPPFAPLWDPILVAANKARKS